MLMTGSDSLNWINFRKYILHQPRNNYTFDIWLSPQKTTQYFNYYNSRTAEHPICLLFYFLITAQLRVQQHLLLQLLQLASKITEPYLNMMCTTNSKHNQTTATNSSLQSCRKIWNTTDVDTVVSLNSLVFNSFKTIKPFALMSVICWLFLEVWHQN